MRIRLLLAVLSLIISAMVSLEESFAGGASSDIGTYEESAVVSDVN